MNSALRRVVLPSFPAMLSDLGNPSAVSLDRLLAVHPRTVERWRRQQAAPRPVMLALYWHTSWGQSELSCELARTASDYAGHIAAVKREADALRRELARVLSAGDFGSANAPTWRETAGELIARRRV